jgi:PIN domain nuclease of toxin-antitoxin system
VRLLLATHAFLWWVSEDASLSKVAREAIGDGASECYFSMASAWELALKVSLGKLTVNGRLDRFLPEQIAANGFDSIPCDYCGQSMGTVGGKQNSATLPTSIVPEMAL